MLYGTIAINDPIRLEVTWTLDDTIWLKIKEGEKKIANKLTSFNKRTLAGKTVLRVALNEGRYIFDYDELTGDFSMEINPIQDEEDVGVWQCHVTVDQDGESHTLTSRSRIRFSKTDSEPRPNSGVLFGHKELSDEYNPKIITPTPLSTMLDEKYSAFTRPEQNVVQISRNLDRRRHTVVFDRSVTAAARHSIDYDLSIEDEDSGRNRARSLHWNAAPSAPSLHSGVFVYSTLLLFLFYF